MTSLPCPALPCPGRAGRLGEEGHTQPAVVAPPSFSQCRGVYAEQWPAPPPQSGQQREARWLDQHPLNLGGGRGEGEMVRGEGQGVKGEARI